MGANPHANGGILLHDLRMPDFRAHAVPVPSPGAVDGAGHPGAGRVPARHRQAERDNAISASSARTRRCRICSARSLKSPTANGTREQLAERRIPRARGPRAGFDAQRTPVRGLAGRLSADRPARAVQQLRGVHSHRRFDVQPAREMAEGHAGAAVAAQDRIAELSARLACLAAGSQWLHPSGSRVSSTM